ncbi:Carbohydrate esterase, family 1 OS=Stigmatella aurantiaca (strain DW4/3-1) GN=STIAU_7120 PE=4 SV=1: Esterase [Gemmata massiliana]|uniref:CBM20 domain-containing protein n=1 Tax=Gemmata massiliana TaxID=1210884 RepID=A0A6P2DE52_9BACT|nr:alpha/beta hydrolase-fold protein [Gemmata massiliana]VTR98785.1 Carbohydrate esterase, family 1 OS=Stigmatella aurantiaca (strain DW4/3-1) GN=STIAU_7120 PE=4 SV=1: Esterase [Gemmata massiliana]
MVEIVVRVPDDTPPWRRAFLAGDGPLGDWSATGVPLDRWDDSTHRTRLDLPAGYEGHFLVTLGRWREAESDGNGHERPPRELRASGPPRIEVDVRGWDQTSVDYHHGFPSRFLPHTRTISVWLPPGYGAHLDRRYPVFYMHDGQNLFDAHTAFAGVPWGADEVAEREIRAGAVPPIILVGVANSPDRLNEYGPQRCGRKRERDLSREYGRFLVEEVKPFVDALYRTRTEPEHTGVGGSSMGGLISLHLCKWYPTVFGKCAALSPSLWWDREYFLRNVAVSPGWLERCRVWVDVGENESSSRLGSAATMRRTRRLTRLLARYGRHPDERYRYTEVPGGTHNERSWGGRFDQVLRFLFTAA